MRAALPGGEGMGGMEPAYLVVVVPGIGGTELAVPGDRSRRIWTAGFGNIGKFLAKPERLSVNEHPVLQPVGLIKTRKAFGIWTAIHGYHCLLDALTTGESALPGARLDDGTRPEPDLDANVVAVGYDFRLGVASAAQELEDAIQPRLEHLWPKPEDRANKVFFVTHSMGGLVARYWAAQRDNRNLCRLILTLGTPHRGAPKALDILANGLTVRGRHVVKWPRAMLREWQGMYDLLPRYQAVTDHSPKSSAATTSSAATMYPKDLPAPWLNRAHAGEAFAMHEFLRESWSDPGWVGKPHLEPRLGYSHGTLQRCTWDGQQISITTQPQTDLQLGAWDDLAGDGTVPSFCAMPIEMSNNLPTGFLEQQRHGPLAALSTVSGWVRKSLGYSSLDAIRGKQRPVVLGVDLEQVLQPRVASLIVAEVRGVQDSPAEAIVRAEIVPCDNLNKPPDTDLHWDGSTGTFRGVLPGLEPGLYDVTVVAEDLPGAGDLVTRETVEVVEDDDLN
jgi:pimeloyl-ACP methyl ester carboxylesterase